MPNKTIIGFGFRIIARIIKADGLKYTVNICRA